MNNIDEVKRKLTKIYPSIRSISSSISCLEQRNQLGLPMQVNDRSDLKLLLPIMISLRDLELKIEILNMPVVAEGILHKNTSDRYEIDERHSFTAGSSIELLSSDEMYGNTIWTKTRIEHNGDEFYAVDMPNSTT
jgi:hypothetical protein